MKNTCIFLFLLIFTTISYAQETLEFSERPTYNKNILIFPFDPDIYLNDATSKIAPNYDMTFEELMLFFRESLNNSINIALRDSCYVIDLLADNTREANDDIDDLYTYVSYEMRPAKPLSENKEVDEDEKLVSKFKRKFGKKEKKDKVEDYHKGEINNGEIVTHRQNIEDYYYHIHFENPDFLPQLSEKRKVDYFLFINLFQIKGTYGTYLSGDPDNTRTLKVHFSLYDHLGECVFGGYASTKIPFDLYDIDTIVGEYYPEIMRQFIMSIPFSF